MCVCLFVSSNLFISILRRPLKNSKLTELLALLSTRWKITFKIHWCEKMSQSTIQKYKSVYVWYNLKVSEVRFFFVLSGRKKKLSSNWFGIIIIIIIVMCSKSRHCWNRNHFERNENVFFNNNGNDRQLIESDGSKQNDVDFCEQSYLILIQFFLFFFTSFFFSLLLFPVLC